MKVSGSVEVEINALISAYGDKWFGNLRADESSLPLLEIELSSLQYFPAYKTHHDFFIGNFRKK
jgi:hypothetical protein